MGALTEGVGRRIQQLRKSAGLTQEQLASSARIDPKYLGSLERGEKSPSFEVLERLITALKVEPYEPFLFSLKGSSEPRADKDALTSLIRRSSSETRSLFIHLIELILDWEKARKA